MSQVTTVLSATEKATKALVAAQAGLTKAMDLFTANAEANEAVLESVVVAQGNLEAIADDTDLAVRNAKVELDLQVRENEDAVLTTLLNKNGLAKLDVDALVELEDQLSGAASEQTKAVNAAVSAVTKELNAKFALESAKADGAAVQELADLRSSNTALQSEVSFQARTIASLEATIKAERDARVAVAEAESNKSGVTVNTSGK